MREDWSNAWSYQDERGVTCIEELKIVFVCELGELVISPRQFAGSESFSKSCAVSGTIALTFKEASAIIPFVLDLESLMTLRNSLDLAMKGCQDLPKMEDREGDMHIEVFSSPQEEGRFCLTARWVAASYTTGLGSASLDSIHRDSPYCMVEVSRGIDPDCLGDAAGALNTLGRLLRQ